MKNKKDILENWKKIQERLKENGKWIALAAGILLVAVFWFIGYKTDIRLILHGFSNRTLTAYCILTLLLLLFAALLAAFFIKGRQAKPEKLFLVCALVLGTVWMFLMPPLSAPDEIVHYSTAYQWSNRMLLIEPVDEDGLIRMRAEDAGAPFTILNSHTKENYQVFFDALSEPCQDSSMVSFTYEPVKMGIFPYFPQAVGITIGRLLHLGWAGTMLLGRLGNLLFFVFCMYQAIKRAPFGKMIFFVVSMLPMTQELVSSFSYDVVPFSLAALFTAICFEDAYVKARIGRREVAVLAVILMVMVPCKLVYVLLAGLCLLIPKEKFGSNRFYVASAAAVVLLAAASLIISNMSTLNEYAGGSGNYIEWADSPGYTLDMLLSNPLHTAFLLLNTIRTQTGYYWGTMIGKKLGWLDVPINDLYILGFSALLFLAALKEEKEAPAISRGKKAWCLVLCAGISFLVLLSMFLGWTPVGQIYIRGVQGRYFLPILPLFLLMLRNRKLTLGGSFVTEGGLDRGIVLTAILMNAFAIQGAVTVMLWGGKP
ncbi:MAG: DUF2142 domain-containing protein [Lachnospiraceae bacterium]|nr:DUF2142 domain-containing protein [Lachnospiraceae bacterium]